MGNKIEKFCFIHIEKAGGSTIHNWLKYYLPNYLSLRPWFFWSNEEKNYLSSRELGVLKLLHPRLKGIGGHTTRQYLKYEKVLDKNINYFTFIREPTSRYLSHFQFQKHKMNIDWTLENFINEPRFNNYMTIRIAGKPCAKTALKLLRNNYCFVGLVEKFNESILLLTRVLDIENLEPLYEKVNEGNPENQIEFPELTRDLQRKIYENNEQDIILYNEVKKIVYEEQVKAYTGTLELDLEDFEKKLKGYKYNRKRKTLIKYYKAYNYYFTEPFAHLFRLF